MATTLAVSPSEYLQPSNASTQVSTPRQLLAPREHETLHLMQQKHSCSKN